MANNTLKIALVLSLLLNGGLLWDRFKNAGWRQGEKDRLAENQVIQAEVNMLRDFRDTLDKTCTGPYCKVYTAIIDSQAQTLQNTQH